MKLVYSTGGESMAILSMHNPWTWFIVPLSIWPCWGPLAGVVFLGTWIALALQISKGRLDDCHTVWILERCWENHPWTRIEWDIYIYVYIYIQHSTLFNNLIFGFVWKLDIPVSCHLRVYLIFRHSHVMWCHAAILLNLKRDTPARRFEKLCCYKNWT